MPAEARVERVAPGRYRLGPFDIVRSTWTSWTISQQIHEGVRGMAIIDVLPTKREAVEAVRRELSGC